jgi:hypothetical protein
MEQLDATVQNRKIGQALAKHSGAPNASARDNEPIRSYPKTHSNYWKARLEHRS